MCDSMQNEGKEGNTQRRDGPTSAGEVVGALLRYMRATRVHDSHNEQICISSKLNIE